MVAVKKDLLQKPANRVRQLLADNASEKEAEWMEQFGRALNELTQGMRLHVAAAEEPNGALATLASPDQDTMATLDRHVRQLRREHVEMLDGVSELSCYIDSIRDRCIAKVTDGVDSSVIPLIQKMAEDILKRLQEHEDAETKLYVATISTDVGVGD